MSCRRQVPTSVAVMSAPATDLLKRQVRSTVEALADELIELSTRIRDNPELGFSEVETARTVAEWLGQRGLRCTYVGDTALLASVEAPDPGHSVALLGELDAVHVPTHPDADARTGAAHACGHHASLAAACGAAVAVSEVMPDLSGRLVFVGTPAEEIRPATQARDRSDGELPTGKSELIRLRVFDDIDLALMVHTGREHGPRFSVGDTLNGAVRVTAEFVGRAAHSGSSPWLGVDATRAARLAMDAVDAQRDQFDPADEVRIGQQLEALPAALGATPASARLHLLVRARSLDALRGALARLDRALYAGAIAIGAKLTRDTELLYVPHRSSHALDDVVEANATEVVGREEHARGRHLGACSDIGDLARVIPVSHPYASGAVGQHHAANFRVVDHAQATVEPATYLAMTIVDLLADGSTQARKVIETDPPQMSREAYLRLRSEFASTRDHWPEVATE